MHVMNGDTSYQLVLGRPWPKAHKAVASTYHQCVKVVWRDRPVTIKATRMPYDTVELRRAKAALYQEFELKGENMILPFNASILEREEKDDREVIEPDRPPKIRKITRLDGKVVYEF